MSLGPKVPLKSWCFTVFNPIPATEEQVCLLKAVAVRLVVGREKCPETGTPHLQGYIRFEKSHRFAAVKKALPDGAHIEPRKGSEKQASDYCKKDGDVLIDQGVDSDAYQHIPKRSVGDETDEVIEEIEKGETWGRIRNRHKRFCFHNRRKTLEYMHDEHRLSVDPDYVPTLDPRAI